MSSFIQMGILALSLYAAYRDESAQVTGDAFPEFVSVLKLDKEKGILTYRVFALKPVHETFNATVNGKSVKRTILRHVTEQIDHEVSLRGARIYHSKGWRLGQAAALEQFSSGRVILKSADGTKVNARYLSAVREDMLILVLPVPEPILIAEETLP